jgi:hypothetical protein
VYPDIPCSSNVPIESSTPAWAMDIQLKRNALANTTVLFPLDNPRRPQEPCLSTCTQLRSRFAQRLSVLSLES